MMTSEGQGQSNRQNFTEGASTNNSSRPLYQNSQGKNDPSFSQDKRPQSKGNPVGRIQPFSSSQEQPNFQSMSGQGSAPFNFTGGPQQQQQPQQMQYIMNCHQEFVMKKYQISPDKAPLVFKYSSLIYSFSNDKRPYTASNSNEVTSKTKRRNSKGSHKQNNTQGGFVASNNYQGSKTHSSGFGLGKYGSNQGLEINQNNLAGGQSIFNTHLPAQSSAFNPNQNQAKMTKIKPTKASMKEKESLYEESIRLKMQSNTYRDENTKLRTKIKILENEINKKEKAMEDIFSQQAQQQQQQYHKPSNSHTNLAPINQAVQKIHSETFLVMSLKKQIKEMKIDLQKREEELEQSKKNLKNTKVQELEVEVKTYKEESLRLRYVIDDLMRQGQNHPMYQAQAQDKLNQQENAINHQNMLIQKLQQDNQEISNLLKQRDDEIEKIDAMVKELSEKHRKEMLKEQSKTKKSVREKEKEINKLKVELISFKKENNQGMKTEDRERQKEKEQSSQGLDQSKVLQAQVNQLQKKLRDANSEAKSNKEKVSEQDQVIKKLQERLQAKIEELAQEQKKSMEIEKQLKEMSEEKLKNEQDQEKVQKLSQKCQKELEIVPLIGRRDKISQELMSYKLKNQLGSIIPDPSQDLKQIFDHLSQVQIFNAIPQYLIPNEKDEQQLLESIQNKLKTYQQSLTEGFTLEDTQDKEIISIAQIKDVMRALDISLTNEEYDYIHYNFLSKDLTGVAYQNLLSNLKPVQTQVKKTSRPQTAKHGGTKNVDTKSQENLNKIEEDEDSYQDDFDQQEKEKVLIKAEESDEAQEVAPKSKPSPKPKKIKSKSDDELEPTKPEDLEEGKYMDEEEMLDIAEHCFIKIAEKMIESNRSVRGIFTKFSIPEQFPDGSILELMSPISFLEGIKELGLADLSEMEAACLLRVLTKPELDSAIILNELILIMENFGVIDNFDDDDEDDYEPDEEEDDQENKDQEKKDDRDNDDQETIEPIENEGKESVGKKEEGEKKDEGKQGSLQKKRKIQLNFDQLEEKGLKILQKLARFLLERYMHPREFFGPAIYKQLVKTKKKENNVDILQTKDFYLKLKLAGIRKSIKEVDNLNKFLCLDTKYPNLLQVKKVVKALEEVAQGEQLKMQEEMQNRVDEESKKANQDLVDMQSPGALTGGPPHMMPGPPNSNMYPQNSYGPTGGPMSRLPGRPPGFEMMGAGMLQNPTSKYIGGYGQLNTIEEEKHETQTSNYFREGDSERDDSRMNQSNHFKTSKLLAELGNESHEFKSSPDSRHSKFKNSPQRATNLKETGLEADDEVKHILSSDQNPGNQIQVIDQQINNQKDEVEEDEDYVEDEYEQDEGEENKEENDFKEESNEEQKEQSQGEVSEVVEDEQSPKIESVKEKSIGEMKSVNSEIDEEVPAAEGNKEEEQDEDQIEQSSDYEF